jgi:hypothetical protein
MNAQVAAVLRACSGRHSPSLTRCSLPRLHRATFARTLVGFAVAFGLAAAIGAASVAADQLIAGANVNVVGGPTCERESDPNCPFQIYGDHTVQRQNEGSGACSARNNANCFAAGNDYRLVKMGDPAVDGKATADAWQGIYWTHNGGATWRSTLLPGFPGDSSPEGAVSPISGFEAAADPTVRPGVAGLLGLSGIAFNRVAEAAAAPISGGEGKSGVQFFSLYFDDNIPVDPDGPGPLTYADVPPRYIRTVIVDSGTSGRFLDKPWHAWDIPRSGGNACTIPAGTVGGRPVPQQQVPTGNLYIAYATFLGTGNNPHGNIWFKSSTDCGAHWSNATKLTESVPISQSPFLSINPVNGNVHVIWREFGQNGQPDRILTVKSTNLGKSFNKPVEIANLGVPSASSRSTAFDAYSLPAGSIQNQRQARSNDYPSACIGTDQKVRVVYSQRISQNAPLSPGSVVPDPVNGWSRIVMQTSADGISWSAAQAVENPRAPGHMFQPAIICTGTGATVTWYDQRNDNAFFLPNVAPFYPFVFSSFIIDPIPVPPVHTIDVRAAQTSADGNTFEASIQVSRYPIAFDTSSQSLVQLQYNSVNWPLFGNGIVPFIGDYPDAFVRNPFKPPIGSSGWSFNDFANETPIVYALWTDNRDVLQLESVPHPSDPDSPGDPNWFATNVRDISWPNFGAPGPDCQEAMLTWTRNQNLYVSGLTRGVVVLAEGNARRSPDIEKRAYVIFIQNQTPSAGPDTRRFRLTFDKATVDPAKPPSFDAVSPVTQIFVDVPSFSGVTRSVFLPKDLTAPVIVLVVEVDSSNNGVVNGVKSSVIVPSDPNAPSDPITEENHDLSLTLDPLQVYDQNGNPTTSLTYAKPTVESPTFVSPTFVSSVLNPTFVSPTFVSPTFVSPTFVSPTFVSPTFVSPTFVSPTFVSPTFVSPTFVSPTFVSPTFVSQPLETDTTYSVTGTGTVTSSYDLDTLIASLPAGATFQILVSKLYETPGTTTCTLGRQVSQQLVSTVTSANASSTPGDVITNSSFSLAPGEQALITLRAACASNAVGKCYDPSTDLSLVVKGHARNCKTGACADKPKQVIDHVPPKLTLPGHITVRDNGSPGEIVTYTATANDFVDGPITPVCTPASGSLFPVGDTTVTCTATDAAGNKRTGTFVVTVLRRL